MGTARVRRETGLMRLLTVMVSGGTPGRFPALRRSEDLGAGRQGVCRMCGVAKSPSTTVAHDRPEGRAVLKIVMSSYGVLALLLSEQS